MRFLTLRMSVVLNFKSSISESSVKSAARFYSLFPSNLPLIFQLSQLVFQTSEKGCFDDLQQ